MLPHGAGPLSGLKRENFTVSVISTAGHPLAILQLLDTGPQAFWLEVLPKGQKGLEEHKTTQEPGNRVPGPGEQQFFLRAKG